MRYPKFLPSKGTIGFAAPSFGCATEPYKSSFDNALAKFKRKGYSVKLGPNCYASKGIGISNSPELCAQELEDMYTGADSDVLISCGGGELMCEILDYLNFDHIRAAEPKWYMGFSDNTNFTFLLTTICDVASIYGPCAGTFGMRRWHKSLQDAFDLLTGEKLSVGSYGKWEIEGLRDEDNPLAPYNLTEKTIIKSYIPDGGDSAAFSGRLVGGCLDCLVHFAGTKFDRVSEFSERYADDGIIWYLEACDLNVFSIRRSIWQLVNAGWFEHVRGFLIGRPRLFGEDMMGLDQYSAVTELLKRYNVPIIMDLDIGHLPPMMPLINGSIANVSCIENRISIDMKCC